MSKPSFDLPKLSNVQPFLSSNPAAGARRDGGTIEIEIALIDIRPGRVGRRRYRDPRRLEQLRESIALFGVLENIIVRPVKNGRFDLIAGEGRIESSLAVGKTTITARSIDVDDVTAAMIALLENSAREDLNAIEETENIVDLIALELDLDGPAAVIAVLNRLKNEEYGKIKTDETIGKQRESVKNVFRLVGKNLDWKGFLTHRVPLLSLPTEIRDAIGRKELAPTKGALLATVENPKERSELLERAIAEGWSVARIREITRSRKTGDEPRPERETRWRDFQKKIRSSRPLDFSDERWAEIDRHLARIEELLAGEGRSGG